MNKHVTFSAGDDSDDFFKSSSSSISLGSEIGKKVSSFKTDKKLREELQEILGEMIGQEHSVIELLRNHAKTISGVLGAEYAYMDKRKTPETVAKEDAMFFDNFHTQTGMHLQDLKMKHIERTPLGRQIKHQIERLEGLNDSMENQLVEVRHQVKQRETAIYEQAEGQLKKIYADKMRKMKEAFSNENKQMAEKYFRLQKDYEGLQRVIEKLRYTITSQEFQLKGARVAARASDLDQMYKALNAAMPDKMKLAMFFVNEFEHDNFDFHRSVDREATLQAEYEVLECNYLRDLGPFGRQKVAHIKAGDMQAVERIESLMALAGGPKFSYEPEKSVASLTKQLKKKGNYSSKKKDELQKQIE